MEIDNVLRYPLIESTKGIFKGVPRLKICRGYRAPFVFHFNIEVATHAQQKWESKNILLDKIFGEFVAFLTSVYEPGENCKWEYEYLEIRRNRKTSQYVHIARITYSTKND